jgi:hypothetical protein
VLPDGATCGSSLDCGSDIGCDVTTQLCTPVYFGQPGDPCDGEVSLCESGSCNKTVGACPAVLADDDACDPTDPSKVCRVFAVCFQGRCHIADPAACR